MAPHPANRKDTAQRARPLNPVAPAPGPVVYWMSRDQRARDNWALLHAQSLALDRRAPLCVVFCLAPHFPGATHTHYAFMLRSLQTVETELQGRNIPFRILTGAPPDSILSLAGHLGAGAIVTDFDPLRIKRRWKEQVARRAGTALIEVDAHNIVPCWIASPKLEFAAYTLRPKLRRLLDDFLCPFPPLRTHPHPLPAPLPGITAAEALNALPGVPPASRAAILPRQGSGRAAMAALRNFITQRLAAYDTARNDPNADGQSGLSPYLHFGQLSAQRVALEVAGANVSPEAKAAFLDELIVRRELSDNFCCYSEHYDQFAGAPAWARATLDEHRGDPREYTYTPDVFEQAETHDPLWNAAQREMVRTGRMHGYMRMYWAKKILEWSPSPEDAIATALHLNDQYELDGRDPNGYAGVMWSICGVHDRAWPPRPVYGKIRYMSFGGCRSKFNVNAYIRRINAL